MSAKRFKAYPEYKDSGVEWLGEIPAHWEAKPLKALLDRNDAGVWGDDFDDEGVLVLRSTEQTVDGSWVIDSPAKRRLTAREASEARLETGDLVVTKSSGSELHIGKTSLVDEQVASLACCFSNFMQRLRMIPPNSPRLYWRLLNCPVAREQLIFLSSTTTGLGNLSGSLLGSIRVPLAPGSEQRAIVGFLDRETARIDGLVTKKERLIELLQEQRTALITRAVTKGLDPNAPMKDSGVEWLGEIPAHWEVRRLRATLTTCQNGVWGEEPDGVHDIPCVRVADFDRATFRVHMVEPTLRSIEERVASARCLQRGDLLLEKSGGGDNQPVGAVVLYDYEVRAVCSNFVARITVADGYDSRFLSYLHAALYAWRINIRHIKQSTGIQNLDGDSYLRESVGLPSESEQHAIAVFLDRETARIDTLVGEIHGAIDRLKELRTALISAAVTGKIDVREEVV